MPDYQLTPVFVRDLASVIIMHEAVKNPENEESVYVLYGVRGVFTRVFRLVQVRNSHPDPVNGFQVRREDLEEASVYVLDAMPWLEVVGVLHTHEDLTEPGPSAEDMESVVHDHLHGIICPFHLALVLYDQDGTVDRFDLNTSGKAPVFDNEDGRPLSGAIITTKGIVNP